MRASNIERVLWVITACGLVAAVLRARESNAEHASHAALSLPSSRINEPVGFVDPDSLSEAVAVVRDLNPFRIDRRASELASEHVENRSAAGSDVRLALRLRGIVGGPPWSVVLDGLPRHPSPVLVRRGDSVGDITVVDVRRDSVFVRTADTSFVLRMVRP